MVESSVTEDPKEAPDKEDPATYKKIIAMLETKKIEFKITIHAPVKTSQEAADVRGVKLGSGAKAMLISDCGKKPARENTTWYLAVMAANKRLSSKKFKKAIGSRNIRFAALEDVLRMTGCVSGAVPPFGSLFGANESQASVPTLVDESLAENETINFNCGLRTHSMQMRYDDFCLAEEVKRLYSFTDD